MPENIFIDLQLARPLPNSIFVDIYKCLFHNSSQYTGTIKRDGLWIKLTNYKFINTDPNLLKMSLEMFSRTLNGSNLASSFFGISDYVLCIGCYCFALLMIINTANDTLKKII